MGAKMWDSYCCNIADSRPESLCKESSTSGFFRVLAISQPTIPADNDRSLKLLEQLRKALRARHFTIPRGHARSGNQVPNNINANKLDAGVSL